MAQVQQFWDLTSRSYHVACHILSSCTWHGMCDNLGALAQGPPVKRYCAEAVAIITVHMGLRALKIQLNASIGNLQLVWLHLMAGLATLLYEGG